MPIKLPKGFARRKSSGNALEEAETAPPSSFRVFERPPGERRSFNDGNLLSTKMSEPLHSATEDPENIFAGSEKLPSKDRKSGGTDQSGLNGDMYESSSSVRFSSSSTCPSSAEVPAPDISQSPHSRGLYDIPVPPLTGALRAAGRTLSFGGRLSKTSTPPPVPRQSTAGTSRDRARTSSTASTATPPKLLDTDLSFGKMEDFQGVFDKVGTMDDATLEEQSHDKPANTNSQLPLTRASTAPLIDENKPQPPIDTNRSEHIDHLPYSWEDDDSEDKPLFTLDPRDQATATAPLDFHQSHSISNSRSVPIPTTSHRSLERPVQESGKALRRSLVHTDRREPSFVEDEDAKLVRKSLIFNKAGTLDPMNKSSDVEDTASFLEHVTALDYPEQRLPLSAAEGLNTNAESEGQLDPSLATHARLAAQYEQNQPKSTPSPTKVMTPSQFEHYRQQQELKRSNSDASKSEDSAESEFDEEDETEKNREAERQRRKQEAHLSVYRQQMMKVTGQQSPSPSLRPGMNRTSNSSPNILTRSNDQGSKSGSGKSSEGDEDDDIPLGILAAHGFPNKNRPPTQLGPSKSIPNLRASFHPHVSSSAYPPMDNDSSNRSSLPVFARNLPRDPYFGASLVNPSNRESLALGGGSSVHGSPSPALPPGGLVGVIATEERARAMRRGSPNPPGLYEHQAGIAGMNLYSNPNPMQPNLSGMFGPQNGLSSVENAQMQLSQQMTQMMQTQMQWMQQMMQMQGLQAASQPQIPRAYPPSSVGSPNMRPASMPSGPALNIPPGGPHEDQRTLSLLDPNLSPRWNGRPISSIPVGGSRPDTPSGQGYTPSIAPSERSNIGMASRYRPVSTMPQEQRSNITPSGSKLWTDENRKSVSNASQSQFHLEKATPTPTMTVRPSSGGRAATFGRDLDDEADDDEGWAEMMMKRERKRHGWKAKRATSPLGDLMNVVH